ncbi:4a-hydroxytetrahydrobiopterin dehydratase [Chitiniphilus eburneus]|uniref:Putative pterin-4-alpha-carbinolamine dehydratase n=1 Tax=Chitiniphilus eburneus TaxID=2571148 RepID=A0A4U0PZH2_9NEIS|nr:4a-hydroxytetrahydrobiopterin dehydratase [Chitiniphilus eburneus]TJZ74071.1 4a-hydroxytetrahydrobiopterin dehydratase [Chitiniphilus eburneus]
MSLADESCQTDAAALSTVEAEMLLTDVDDWLTAQKTLEKTFRFKNFHETMAFVNAVSWIAHRQDHHPDLEVSYSRCKVSWSTHSAGGLTRNDFICAARVDALQS